jgi:hypothetical protein
MSLWVGFFVLACLAALPRIAQAHQCFEPLMSAVPETRSEQDDISVVCDGAVVVVSHRDVPICMSEGASAVAPLPLSPTTPSTADASPRSCNHAAVDAWAPNQDLPDKLPKSSPEAALPGAMSPPLGDCAPLVLPRSCSGRAALAHSAAVYRPPRA